MGKVDKAQVEERIPRQTEESTGRYSDAFDVNTDNSFVWYCLKARQSRKSASAREIDFGV